MLLKIEGIDTRSFTKIKWRRTLCTLELYFWKKRQRRYALYFQKMYIRECYDSTLANVLPQNCTVLIGETYKFCIVKLYSFDIRDCTVSDRLTVKTLYVD